MNEINRAIIGGSTGFRALQGGEIVRRGESIVTPFGPSSPVHVVERDGFQAYYLSRHGESGYHLNASSVNYRANIWALKELGVERIIAWSGPGAIDEDLPPGELVIPADIIDETRNRPYTFYEGTGLGFVRENPVFCPDLSARLTEGITREQGHAQDGKVYVCTEGPRLETPAEIRKFRIIGGHMVGMTLAPEAFLARELEMHYCPLCYVTNYAEGTKDRPYKPGELFEGMLTDEEKAAVDAASGKLLSLAMNALKSDQSTPCHCAQSMERYRRRGDIGPDWRAWIKEMK